MLISLVIFGFGMTITIIVSLGLLNAKDMQARQSADYQFDLINKRPFVQSGIKNSQTSTKQKQIIV